MIILDVSNIEYTKKLPAILLTISFIVFLIAASPGILPIYYKEVSFAVIEGAATLIKVYGPLHPLYLFYLLGYFSTMVIVIIHASAKKKIENITHAIILAVAVFVNIGVWLIEQISNIGFEMLSISYIISEIFLLGIHLVMNENQRLRDIITQVETIQNDSKSESNVSHSMLETPLSADHPDPIQLENYIEGLCQLTPTERIIYDAYVARVTTKELLTNLNIKENTLKYHNKNIYNKLNVSSRKELLEIHKHITSLKTTI